MFRSTILLFFGCLLCFQVSAQTNDWAAIGTTWWYNYALGDHWGTEGYMTMESVKDTMIDGNSCRKLEWKSHFISVLDSSITHQPYHSIYTYEDGGKIYAWLVDSFYIIHDFTLGAGDTLAIRNGFDLNQLYTQKPYSYLSIDSVDTLHILGKDRKVQYYRQLDSWHIWTDFCLVPQASPYNVVAIEGIGWDGFIFPVAGFVDPENGGPLRCYFEPGLGLNNCGSVPCDTMYRTFTGVEEGQTVEQFPVKIINHLLWYEFQKPVNLTVYDALGRLVLERRNMSGQHFLPLPEFVSGYLIVECRTEGETVSQTFLIP